MEKEILNIDWFDLAIICKDYTVSDITDDYDEVPNEELINDFELIHSETLQYDLEDQTEQTDIILFRKSSGQYFKGTVKNILWDCSTYPYTLTQVFPTYKAITVYE